MTTNIKCITMSKKHQAKMTDELIRENLVACGKAKPIVQKYYDCKILKYVRAS